MRINNNCLGSYQASQRPTDQKRTKQWDTPDCKESEVNKITPSLQKTDCYLLNPYVSVEQEEADNTTNSKDVNSTVKANDLQIYLVHFLTLSKMSFGNIKCQNNQQYNQNNLEKPETIRKRSVQNQNLPIHEP
ncbi:hypothetical protein P5673_031340 [Acropora cervicornis]|uniref:Uncharacterized protein n=1 Tax=Acropora cervicornis TaxID=6130 RepID=A0AAD9USL8_ACRCE|nr:hypothetical protein P5673_031340 [Acropora cervicornis]